MPCAEYYKRQGFPLKKIVKYASNRDYSDLLVFNEDRKEVGHCSVQPIVADKGAQARRRAGGLAEEQAGRCLSHLRMP